MKSASGGTRLRFEWQTWADCVEEPAARLVRAPVGIVGEWGPTASSGQCRRSDRDQPGHLAKVLGGGGEEELVFCSVWSSEAQAI